MIHPVLCGLATMSVIRLCLVSMSAGLNGLPATRKHGVIEMQC